MIIVVKGRKPGAYAEKTRQIFNDGVRNALGNLARHGIATAAEVNGKFVYGVPRKSGGEYVLKGSEPAKSGQYIMKDSSKKSGR